MKRTTLVAPTILLALAAACGDDTTTGTTTDTTSASSGGAGGSAQGGQANGGNASGGSAQGGNGGAGTFTISVDVSGLITEGLQVTLNGADTLTIDTDGVYAFTTTLADGAGYTMTAASPRGEACVIATESGSVAGADVTADVDCLPAVTAVYEPADQWNDYLNATGTAPCAATFATGYDSCLHAGERLFVYVPDASDCTNISATDALGAFAWVCDDSELPVRMLSTGLVADKGLTDLVDFDASAWRDNSVTISDDMGTIVTTAPAAWWTNAVTSSVPGGSLDTSSTIYALDVSPNAALTIDADSVALVVKPGVAISGGGSGIVVEATQRAHFWFEGTVDATGEVYGIVLDETSVSMIRGATFVESTGLNGLLLQDAHSNLLTRIETSEDIRILGESNRTTVVDAHFTGAGLELIDGNNAEIRGLRMGGDGAGLEIGGSAIGAVVNDVRVHDAGSTFGAYRVDLMAASVRASDIVVSGCSSSAIRMASDDGVLVNATATNNTLSGIVIEGASTGVLANLITVNNGGTGLYADGADVVEVHNLITTHNGTGVLLTDITAPSLVGFTGVLKVGNNGIDCQNQGSIGISNTCTNSTATVTTGASAAATFFGKVTSNDSGNASDTNGTATASAVTDFTHFVSPHRTWGRNGSAFPNSDHRGRCSTGTCRIWDWSLHANDTVARAINTAPHGDDTLTAGTVTFLVDAVEIFGDGVGDDDGLCESNETCRFAPNAGSYQGHGATTNVIFIPGTITGVTLQRFGNNGFITL